jgi:hypothetical protein
VWFIHWRGPGDPLALATAVHKTVKATSTPLPQAPPANPTAPLDPERLKSILHGFDVDVGSDGVVTVLQPGDGRASAAVLLPPVQARRSIRAGT